MRINWTLVKVLAAHVYGDWAIQTCYMAQRKNHCATVRTQHVAMVAGSMTVAMLTDSNLNLTEKLLVVALNTTTHWLIDSFVIPKYADQALHVGVAVGSVYAVNWRGKNA